MDRKPIAWLLDSEKGSTPNKVGAASSHFEKEIAVWRDPLTPPHTRTECCKVEEIDHTGIKVCTQYCTDCQWMYVHAWLVVDITPMADILKEINECHDQAAAAGLAGGIITAALGGGGAALDAAINSYVAAFSACLASHIAEKILNVRVDLRPGWGDWEGC